MKLKKFLSFILAFALIFTAMPSISLPSDAATSGTTKGGCEWELNGTVLEIYGSGEMGSPYTPWGSEITEVIIHYGVTSIGSYAFKNCTSLTKVSIPTSVKKIYWGAFYNCTALKSIALPNSITSISYDAFYGCKSLTTVVLPNKLTELGSGAFSCCTSLSTIEIPSTITEISDDTFYNCTSLKNFTIPTSITSIGDDAFAYCRNLASITIPNTVTKIGDRAFSYCESISRITIPNSDTNLGSGVFKGCTSLTQFTIPNGFTEIADSLFHGCSSLKNVTIPNSVISIGDYTFRDCSKLTEISIPSSITNIGKQAFYHCSSLTEINIPDGITSINDNTFSGCTSLTKIDIPKGVSSIGSGVFYDCSLLTEIIIPDKVTLIKDHTFYNCSALKNITIPSGVTSIGNYAFYNCELIKEINLPSGVTSIGSYAFYNCESLKETNIPSGVTSIGSYAFWGCSRLEEITIPSGVTSIEESTFSNCSDLKNITIPNGVTSIGSFSFLGCTSIREITIPNSVTSIGDSAFSRMNLVTVTIPSSVTNLGKKAFYSCLGLTEVTILGNITAIEDETFKDCSSLKTVVLPNSVKSIGSHAFYYCLSLTEISIPSGVELIEAYAFDECSALKKVTLPNTVIEIQFGAFEYCPELDYVWYSGSIDDRNNISISGNSYSLTSAIWYYNVCENVHAYSGDCDNSCLYCGNIRQTITEHTYINGFDTICNSCGATRNITDKISGNYTYKVSNGNAIITGCRASTQGEIVVPQKLDGYSVTGIGENAFYNCGNITIITIPSNIINISSNAFTRCFSLKRIEVAENNQNYCSQSGILYSKDKKTLICKPYNHTLYFKVNYVYYTGEKIFDSVEKELKVGNSYSAEIPGVDRYTTNIDSISGTMSNEDVIINVIYYENPKLNSGKCNNNITWTLYEDGGLVFRGSGAMPDYTSGGAPWAQNASDVKEVYIDSRITSIGNYAFENCSNLTFVDYGYSISSIGKYAFSGCSSLTSFKLPNTVTTVSEGAFMGCSGLATVVIPDNITAIGNKAFYNCQNLTKVTLGGAVTSVGSNAFDSCAKLSQIYFRGNPANLGTNAFGSTSGKYLYYYSTVAGWKDAVVNGKWNGYSAYPYDLIAKEGFDGTNPYAIKVVDKHNTPLQGAIVQLDGKTGYTDKYGLAYFAKPTGSVNLRITCSNHRDFTDEEFTVSSKQAIDVIELSDKPSTVQGVRLDGKSIATSVETLNCGEEKTVKITVNGYSKYSIIRYELHQGNRLIATNKTSASSTTFSVKTSAFEEGETVFVEMYTADGGMVATALNIDVIKLANISESQILNELSNIDLSIGLGSMGNYKIPLAFEASGEEKFYTSINGRTIRVGINLDVGELFEKEQKPNKTKIQQMVDKSMKNFAKGKPGFEYNVCGYLEIEYLGNGEYIVKTSYVKVGVSTKLSFNAQASYFGVVGVYFKAELKGDASLDMHITHYTPDSGFKVDDLNFALENTLALEGGAYLLWGAGSAGIYGKANMGFVLGIIPDVEFESVYIKGEVGVKWSVLWGLFTGDYKFLSGDIYRWPEAQMFMLRSVTRTLFAAQQDPNSYKFNDRTYLENRSEWLSGEYLQKNIYNNVAPKIVTCGDTTIMVWLDDNASRADADFQTLYYSILENGVWSAPIPVCDNGTFDCEFDVYTDGEKIYVVYTEMTGTNAGIDVVDLNNEDGFASFVNDVEVSVIVFENGKFGTAKQITDNKICEILPRLALIDGKITAIWSESESVGLSTNVSGNKICCSALQFGKWSLPSEFVGGQNIVSDITAVTLADGSFTAYIVDSDNSAQTNDDQSLIICNKNGYSVQVDSGLIMNVETAKIGGVNALVWYNNGKIYMITESTQKPICLVPENAIVGTNYQIISVSQDKDLLTFVMGNTDSEGNSVEGSDIYAVYINKNGCLTSPVKLTETDGYVENYSVCYLDGKLVTVFTETFADVSGETVKTTTHLRKNEIEFITDIKLNGVNFDTLSAKPQSNLELTLNVSNNGTVDVDGFTVNIYDKEGNLISTVISQTSLKSGETSDAVISFTLPENLSADGYVVEILPGYAEGLVEDAKSADNTKDISVAYADMEISAEQKIIGEKNYIILTVINNGNLASKVDLKLFNSDISGELLSHIKSENAINPGCSEVYTIELDSSVENVVTCFVESEVNDPFALNNSESLTIFNLNEDVFVSDPDEVIYNPTISFTTAYFDKRDPSDISFVIEECLEYFSNISGLTLNNEYTISNDTVCIKKEYLNGLAVGNHTLKLVFDFGNGNVIERTLDIKVSDTRPIALEGSVSIIGEILVGETVYADVSGINTNVSNLSIEWHIDGVVVGTGSTYTIKPEDNTKKLSLVVYGKNGYSGTLEVYENITLRKPDAPAAPIVSKITNNSITLTKIDGVEYSLDGTNWQDSGLFEGLSSNQTYYIYARIKASNTNFASEACGVSVTTAKNPQTRPSVAPAFAMKDCFSITLAFVEGAEYRIEGGEWTDNNVFRDLTHNTTYKFYQRYKETDDTCAGEIRTSEITTLDKIAISGSISIVGKPQCGTTLEVDLSKFIGNSYTVTYQWYVDGVEVIGANASAYKVTGKDIGKTITVVVGGTGIYKGTLSADIEIPNIVLGDVNHDNVLDETDAEILGKYVAKWENITIYEPACDINCDGVINIKDVTILKRHLANWPGYEDLLAIA